MGKPKKQAKLALKTRSEITHKGIVKLVINLGNKIRNCPCGKLIGKKQFVVEYNEQFYCNWSCSDVAD